MCHYIFIVPIAILHCIVLTYLLLYLFSTYITLFVADLFIVFIAIVLAPFICCVTIIVFEIYITFYYCVLCALPCTFLYAIALCMDPCRVV